MRFVCVNLACSDCSTKAKLLLCLSVKCPSRKDIKHLTSVVCVDRAVVHVTQSLPQGLTFEFSLLKALLDSKVVATRISLMSEVCSLGTSSCRLNLFHQALVLLVEHADIAFKTVGFTFHVAVNFCPFVLLLARHTILFN